jgi:RHS repeat-associated protein
MSTTSTAQSNAFNFTSFVQNSVDPRTGQYTLGIELPELVGNDQQGPALPLRLAFSPMNHTDAGFGHGWSLNLSQYRPASNLLSLQNGETFKVDGSDVGDGTGLGITERKIESFHLHQESSTCWRVDYKTGLVEFLELMGPSQRQVALPVRIEAASGHWINLRYDHDFNGNPCLTRITDANGTTLLTVNYDSGAVSFELFPDAARGDPSRATYRMQLQQLGSPALRLATHVFLPTAEDACWQFEYLHLAYTAEQNLALLKQVKTPLGATETLEHWQGNDGHHFPGDARPPLPRVKRHQMDPGFGQPVMVTTYTYTDNNFLGYGASGVKWSDDGQDNLYQFTGSDYEYASTASLWLKDEDTGTPGDGKALRTVTRRYNRFHLMRLETETQNGHIQETSTVYHEVPGLTFERQPSFFQLPHQVTLRWKLEGSDTWPRQETKTTTFDMHGNLLKEIEPDGRYTEYTYYEIEGETEQAGDTEEVACPPDPQGFKRRIKYKTTYPAESGEGQAAILRSHYRYRAIGPVTGARKTFGEAVVKHQRTLQLSDASDETGTLLQLSEATYLDMPDKPLLHMRLDQQRQTLIQGEDPLKNRTTTTRFVHSLIKDEEGHESLLQVRQTIQGHDQVQRTLHSAVSRYCGLAMRQQDSNGVYTYTYYDALRRTVRQTVAPDKPALSATRTYAYQLSANGAQASQSETDVQGVVNTQWLDGAGRSVRETREVTEDDDQGKPRRVTHTVQTHQYDNLGRQVSQTVHDHLDGTGLELTSTFEYDDWGERCTTIRPDGVIERRERSPFGKEGFILNTWQERPNEEAPVRRQWQVTELNRFGKPEYQQRNAEDGQEVGRQQYFYDGFGRCVREVSHLRDPLDKDRTKVPLVRTTRFTYDTWGRMTHHERPDASTLIRHFADFCTDELVTRLELQAGAGKPPSIVCHRTFDGLARMKTLIVGTRTESYTYQSGQTLVHQHQRASGRTRTYSYQPEVSTEPTGIATTNQNGVTNLDPPSFDYERPDAAITAATNAEGKRRYSYTDQGYLLRESWATKNADGDYEDEHFTEHRHSLQGRLLSRSSDAGEPIEHHYDAMGRLKQTVQGELQADFEYDIDGRPCKTVTLDKHSQRTLTCLRQYDCLGRETERTLTLDDGTTQTLTLVWRDDDQLHQRLRCQDGQLLLEETFQYDDLDRLEKVEYSGTQLPGNSTGRAIRSQLFRFDAMDNMTRCQTTFADGQKDDARFTYKADGSFQLERVTHSLQPDYPADQTFSYDADGNMRNDDWGRQLHYDDLGRLAEVRTQDDQQVLARYRYDGHDHLLGVRHGTAAEVQRRYQGYRLSATLEDGVLNQYLYDGETALAMQTAGQPGDSRLLLTDAANSVLGEYAADGVHVGSYSVYGERAKDEQLRSLLAFNGEACEPAFDAQPTGWYLLGRGYRAYNPQLMRFHSPDSLAPEVSGVNPYVYALGNPVNWYDPTGHYGEALNDPLPGYQDPIKQPKASFMEKWSNVLYAGIGVITGLAFTFIFPPAGIGIALAVVGNALAFGGLAATVVGTLKDDPQLVMYGLIGSAIGGAIASLSAIGNRIQASRSARVSARAGTTDVGVGTTPRVSVASSVSGTGEVGMSARTSPAVSPQSSRRSSVASTPTPDYDQSTPPSPPPPPPASVQTTPKAPDTQPASSSNLDLIGALTAKLNAPDKGLRKIQLHYKKAGEGQSHLPGSAIGVPDPTADNSRFFKA